MDLKVQIQSGTSTWHEPLPAEEHKPAASSESAPSHSEEPQAGPAGTSDRFESGKPAGSPRHSNVEFNF